MMRNLTQLTFGTLLLALLPLCGCEQGLGGGANTPSSVTLIVSGAGGSDVSPESPETVGPAAVAGFGTVKGKVVIEGTAPTLAMLVGKGSQTKAGDELCAVNGVPNESVIVDANGGLANVFVYLKKVPKGVEIPPAPSDKIIFDQLGCIFTPHAFVARVGQTIVLTNSDGVAHNVHTNSNNKALNSAIPAKKSDQPAQTLDLVYEKPEDKPIKTTCDFHGWMDSYHLVVNHPWVAVTGPDGSFEIPTVPAGKMTFVIWHEKVGNVVNRGLEVDVVPDQPVTVPDIRVPVAKLVK
jgi:hypothetical protein